jgi:two-component system chemotaxis sensor kinase CheA
LVPVTVLFAELERVVRDAANQLGKEAEIRTSGSDTHVDARVLARLHKALVHIVRNSVAHGIEDPMERVQLGKPRVGQIDLAIERRGHLVYELYTFAFSLDHTRDTAAVLKRCNIQNMQASHLHAGI